MSKPISPDEVGKYKAGSFPPEVFEAFNELIAAEFVGGRAVVHQSDVVNLIKSKLGIEPGAGTAFSYKWLNVEEAYRDAGWKVEYDKPGYNESYGAFFIFRKN